MESIGDPVGGQSKHYLPYGTTDVYDSYGFSPDRGYYGEKLTTVPADNIAGWYRVVDTQVILYTGSEYVEDEPFDGYDGYWHLYGKIAALALGYTTIDSYSQGTTNYGSVMAAENILPEDGTLIEGSASGDYCILNVNGTYYYYVKK